MLSADLHCYLSKNILLRTVVLDRANRPTVARVYDESIKVIDENFDKSQFTLHVKTTQTIQKFFFPKVTRYLSDTWTHQMCEQIRGLNRDVDHLIANVKKYLQKRPH